MDRAVLMRDLVEFGYVSVTKGANGKVRPSSTGGGTGGTGGGSGSGDPTVEFPSIPAGVYASGGFSHILVAWDAPSYKGHSYANVYRSATDDYSKAVKIGQTAANLYSDPVAVGSTWYYWIRFVNKNNVEGPIQSTNGAMGKTSDAIGDIMDQLKGQIDETFFTPVFNSRLDNTDADIKKLFGDISDIDNKYENKFEDYEDKFVDISSILDELKDAGEIIAEAAMEAAVGVEIESDTRRKITARIEETQRTIVTDQIAMAEDIKTVTASVDENKAQISITNTALVELDKDTKEAVKTITERLDTQQSNIDDNKASIVTQSQTLVSVKDSVDKNTGEIDKNKQDLQSVTSRLDQQQSEIDDNKASITTQQQTIVTIDGKVTDNESDIKDTADKVEVITQRVDTLTSEVGDNKAQISQTQQTVIEINGKVTDNANAIDSNTESIKVVTSRVDQQQSEIDNNTATITSQQQTIVKIDGEVQENKKDVAKAISDASHAQSTADGKIDTFFQGTSPAGAKEGDIWFDTAQGNKQYIFNKGNWVVAQDTAIGDAILAASGAQSTANSKIQTFYQPNEPQAGTIGDLWVDTDNKNKLFRWNGTAWLDAQDGNIEEIKGNVEVITQRVDTMKSEIDNNTAEITDTKQTLVTIDGKVADNTSDIADANQSITTMTQRLESQQSEIDGNKASISSQAQTIVTIDGKVSQNASDIDTANKSIETITQKQDEQKSELDGAKATIESNSQTIARIEGELGEDGDTESDILAEAVMSTAIGVDNEGSTRRKVSARIEKQQRVIMTDQAAMAQELTKITASIGDNEAAIQSVSTALVEFDKETEQALKVMTERLDTQQSNIDDNKASITTQQQTIVKIEDDVQIISERIDTLKSEVDGNTASITSQGQTLVVVNDKAEANEAQITVVSQQLNTVESELGDTKSAVSTNSQTIAKMNADGTTAYEAQWGVKASVGDVQAGIGLVAKKNPDGTTTSQCTVLADQFSVGHVNSDGDDETIYPFIVTSKGVYIDTAYIKAATVQELVAGEVIADTVKASASITAPNIVGGNIKIGSNFNVDENGNATVNNMTGKNVTLSGIINASSGTFRGTVYANSGEFRGAVYATTGDFKGTVYANKISGDVVTAKVYSASNSEVIGTNSWSNWKTFDSVTVRYSSSRSRQLVITVSHEITLYEHGKGSLAGQVRITGTFGTIEAAVVNVGNLGPGTLVSREHTLIATVPAGTTGTMHIQHRGSGTFSGTTTKGKSTLKGTSGTKFLAQLITSGTDLS
ncbi:tail fiber protein [Vibrio phage K250 g1]